MIFTEETKKLRGKLVLIDWVDDDDDWPFFTVDEVRLQGNGMISLTGASYPSEFGMARHEGDSFTAPADAIRSMEEYELGSGMSNAYLQSLVASEESMSDNFVYMMQRSSEDTTMYDVSTEHNGINDVRAEIKIPLVGDDWSEAVRGKTVATLKDNGNGVKIKFVGFNEADNDIRLDYAEFEELRALVMAYDDVNDRKPLVISKFKRVD